MKLNNPLVNFLRHKVSGDKKRLITGEYDIDLTYITDRIVAMSFPAEGVESAYRNDINYVSEYLNSAHPGRYVLYNLSQRYYDFSKFDDVVNWCGWPDHHAPPIPTLIHIIHDMLCYLIKDPKNIVVVHCLAGKGRTGCVISSFLLYIGLFENSDDARRYFAAQRSCNRWGVAGPSQIRTVDWFADILDKKIELRFPKLMLTRIIFEKSPNLPVGPTKTGITPLITVFNSNDPSNITPVWTNKMSKLRTFDHKETDIIIDVNQFVHGDMNILIEHAGGMKHEKVSRLSFHTAMIPQDTYTLSFMRHEIDDAVNDMRFPVDFEIRLVFEEIDQDYEETEYIDVVEIISAESRLDALFELQSIVKPEICFTEDSEQKVLEAKTGLHINQTGDNSYDKAGYLTKQGEKVKSWKRRWFVTHPDRLEYYNKPNSTTPLGTILMKNVLAVLFVDEDSSPYPFMFNIVTVERIYCIYADNEAEREAWVDAIQQTSQLARDKFVLGTITIKFHSAYIFSNRNRRTANPYCVITSGRTCICSDTQIDTLEPEFSEEEHELNIHGETFSLNLELWDAQETEDILLGEMKLYMKNLTSGPFEAVKEINVKKDYGWESKSVGTVKMHFRFKPGSNE